MRETCASTLPMGDHLRRTTITSGECAVLPSASGALSREGRNVGKQDGGDRDPRRGNGVPPDLGPAVSDWSMPSRVIRTCFLLLSLGLVAAPAKDPGAPPRSRDWNHVHALTPGVITHVRIQSKEAPQGERKFKGFFSSSTDSSITLLFRDGATQTIERRVVSTVRVRRPFKKRYTGWAMGIASAAIMGYLSRGPKSDFTKFHEKFFLTALVACPSAVAGFFMMPKKLVYRAPRNP